MTSIREIHRDEVAAMTDPYLEMCRLLSERDDGSFLEDDGC
jgi:hypothetical protein